jgi:hypothetical protein
MDRDTHERLAVYIIGGVLPAFSIILLGLAAFMFRPGSFDMSLIRLGCFGAIGLALAPFNSPHSVGLLRRLVVSAMLIMGLIALFQLLLMALTPPVLGMWHLTVVLSPTMLALFYLWEVVRSMIESG